MKTQYFKIKTRYGTDSERIKERLSFVAGSPNDDDDSEIQGFELSIEENQELQKAEEEPKKKLHDPEYLAIRRHAVDNHAKVWISRNNERSYYCYEYAIVLADTERYGEEYWLCAFKTERAALRYCQRLGLTLAESEDD